MLSFGGQLLYLYSDFVHDSADFIAQEITAISKYSKTVMYACMHT